MKLNRYENAEAQISGIIDYLTATISTCLKSKPSLCIAVSGGKSPIALFEKLSQQDIDWSKIIITLVDERFVETNSLDSNESLVKNHLLQNLAEKTRFIGLSNIQAGIVSSRDDAEKNVPEIDIAILGMGEDGHTASIFPCCKELKSATNLNQTERYVITHPVTANYSRIGLNLTALIKIPKLILSINGKKKLEVLEKSLENRTSQLPIGLLLANRTDSEIFWFE